MESPDDIERPAPPDWQTIRGEYEGRLFEPKTICKRHGITVSQLRYRRQCEGWLSQRERRPKEAVLVSRMLKVLERQIRDLEMARNEPVEKRTNTLATQVKTLDKLIELGAAERNVDPAGRKDMTDLRAKLVKRLDQFKSR
ncbi:hypothetical protein GGR20_000680 [Devosia subaequoris]|uniref:Uncharacterized protein n=1 Tax=Devosia subaequoris TaxID=395930 RepID=A0A7W6IK28_9HYPH|nr:hypothetical protein [Devosia subaequoris]MBB4051062.1 hypothetical protein [Devosia subaequoris]MCP1208271.1 hypothetical protein [Devosia subaequoris]